jgi:hypothetical protein
MDQAFIPPHLSMKGNLSEGFHRNGADLSMTVSSRHKRNRKNGFREMLKERVALGTLPGGFCFRAHHKGLLRIRQQYLAGVPEVGWLAQR